MADASSPLVGRAPELALIGRVIDATEASRAHVLVFEGEPGIGKTRLLEHAVAVAAQRQWHTAVVRGAEFERELPLVALRDGLGLRREQLAQRLPQPAEKLMFSGELPHQLVDALVDVIEERAIERPLLLAVDDLQWLDAASLTALSIGGRRLADLAVAFVVTVRSQTGGQEVAALLDRWRISGAEHVVVGGLEPAATEQLAAALLGGPPTPQLSRQLVGAAGNPFYVTELVRTVAAEALDQSAVPPSLRLTVLRRLSTLPEATIELLRRAALLGRSFDIDDLATVAGLDAAGVVQGLQPAIDAAVLEGLGDALAFRHDLVRDALYGDQPEAVRRVQHREAGRALAAANADAGKVAAQLQRAAKPGDEEAIGALRRASTEALATAPAVAVEHLEAALELAPTGELHGRVVADLFRALLLVGRAREVVDQAPGLVAPLAEDPGGARVWRQVGRALQQCGLVPEAIEVQRALVDLAPDQRRRVHSLSELAMTATLADEAGDTEQLVRYALAETEASGEHVARSVALGAQSLLRSREGHLLEAAELAGQARAAAARSPVPIAPPLVLMAHALIETDRFDEARASITGSQDREASRAVDSPFALFTLGLLDFATGDWEEAAASLEATIESLDARHLTFNGLAAAAIVASIAVHQGDLGRAEARLDSTSEVGALTAETISLHVARAELWEANGDPGAAFAVLAPRVERLVAHGLLPWCRVAALPFVRLAARVDRRQSARPLAAALELMAERTPLPSVVGLAAACRGIADDDAASLERAVAAYGESARRFERAQVLEFAGGAEHLEEARLLYASVSAALDEARVDAALRALGVRRGSRRPHRQARTGWGSLTEAELRVVALVAEGLGSRQIGERLYISRRTVDSHLAHVFTKLGINSRTELAAKAVRHLGEPGPG